MNWRTRAEVTPDILGMGMAGWTREVLKELQMEWRSRPLIRHLSALALCLLVVLVGVLERSTHRASVATTMTSTGRTVEARPTQARAKTLEASMHNPPLAEGRLTEGTRK
jgi:hypothetical protein